MLHVPLYWAPFLLRETRERADETALCKTQRATFASTCWGLPSSHRQEVTPAGVFPGGRRHTPLPRPPFLCGPPPSSGLASKGLGRTPTREVPVSPGNAINSTWTSEWLLVPSIPPGGTTAYNAALGSKRPHHQNMPTGRLGLHSKEPWGVVTSSPHPLHWSKDIRVSC